MPKTIVTKRFARKIQTSQFENLEVVSGLEEEILYTDEHDLQIKIDALRTKALNQFMADFAEISNKLGVEEKRVFVKSPKPDPYRSGDNLNKELGL